MRVREPAVAGLFYEADPFLLQQHIDKLLGSAFSEAPVFPKAVIVPHAGLIYSGATAAEAYHCIQQYKNQVERVVLLGPAHRCYLQGLAMPSVDFFKTPLGNIPLDKASINELIDMEGICVSDEAHREEHSLEVQLPFLQTVLGDFELIPIVVGVCEVEQCAAVVDALWGGDETLVVISTDLSHFLSYKEAVSVDEITSQKILNKDVNFSGSEACGAYALNGFLACKRTDILNICMLDLRNSGDTAGDKNRVVGYGAFSLS